jgi:signal transduction histidine kinase
MSITLPRRANFFTSTSATSRTPESWVRNHEGAALNLTVLAVNWQTHWIRTVIEFAVLVAVAIVLWRLIRDRRHNAEIRNLKRNRAAILLKHERMRRLDAQQKSRSLSQRLLTAHEAERSYLARELHDDVTQRLARLAIDAAQLERGVSATLDGPTPRSMREELTRLSEDVHSLAYRLHPSLLEDLGLVEALRAECSRFSRQQSVRAELKARDVPEKIPRDAAFALFRVGQEALRNVARHARARNVQVSIALMDGGLHLAVRDDGVGFNPIQVESRQSLGLSCMKERINLVDGELDIESAPGEGTTIIGWVPLKERLIS